MGATSRPIAFLDLLPAVFRRQGEGDELLRRFLAAFEALFEELEDAIEGSPDGVLRLRVVASAAAGAVRVEGFRPGPVPRPKGTVVTAADGRRTTLAEPIPAGDATAPAVDRIRLADADLAAALAAGDELTVHAGGLPDLFHFQTTPPPQLRHSPATELAHLAALAAWLDLPLRPEKPVDVEPALVRRSRCACIRAARPCRASRRCSGPGSRTTCSPSTARPTGRL